MSWVAGENDVIPAGDDAKGYLSGTGRGRFDARPLDLALRLPLTEEDAGGVRGSSLPQLAGRPSGNPVDVLAGLSHQSQSNVAVEVNREVVPRKAHASTPLSEGDSIEVVTLVGGG